MPSGELEKLVGIGMQASRFGKDIVVDVYYSSPLRMIQRWKLMTPLTVISLIIFLELHVLPPVFEKRGFNGIQFVFGN